LIIKSHWQIERPIPADMKKTADLTTANLVVALAAAYRSLAEFLEEV